MQTQHDEGVTIAGFPVDTDTLARLRTDRHLQYQGRRLPWPGYSRPYDWAETPEAAIIPIRRASNG